MFKRITFAFFILMSFNTLTANEYHVSMDGNDTNAGSLQSPFKTISNAVRFALAGDTITVHEGVYREWVNPIRGGMNDDQRITYRAATGEKVEIKGSEVIKDWKRVKNGVWKVTIPNQFFGNYNPFKDSIAGDWFHRHGRVHHTGDVYLNGKSLYEKESLEKVFQSTITKINAVQHDSVYAWFTQSDEFYTTIWANFHAYNPTKEVVEISVRPTCFYPISQGINYLTISGFNISQAATQWAAPTAEQVGMVATNGSKGWIIENNVISNSRCNGITLGKTKNSGHNVWSADIGNVNNDGNIHFIEIIFKELRNGWDKQNIGSHIVRNNEISNCEQTAICGSFGAIFSTIENNYIHHIWVKRQFGGYEMAGIKFHAPIDVRIENNRIDNCGRGIWLDWMTQGTVVSRNLLYNNDNDDLFIEVSHGPYLVSNNIFLSPVSIRTWSECGAYVHNLIGGAVSTKFGDNRFTPYHVPNSTQIAGFACILGGDDSYYNNLFVNSYNGSNSLGLDGYKAAIYPSTFKNNLIYNIKTPNTADSTNVWYLNHNPDFKISENGKEVFLSFKFNSQLFENTPGSVTAKVLGRTKVTRSGYNSLDFIQALGVDYFGLSRNRKPVAGPFSDINLMENNLKVW